MKKILSIIVLGLTLFIGWFFIEKPEPPFLGAVVQLEADEKTIVFDAGDSVTKEDLIVISDSDTYNNNSDIYFSIENTTAVDQNVSIVFTVKDSNTKMFNIQEFVSNTEIIKYASDSQTELSRKTVSNWSTKGGTTPNLTALEDSIKSNNQVEKKTVIGSYSPTFLSTIKAGETKFYKTKINAPIDIPQPKIGVAALLPEETSQEFYIEVFGDNGGYGHLY